MADSEKMIDSLTSMISTHLYVSQSTQIKTASIEANYLKNSISDINPLQSIQDNRISISSLCELLNSDCSNRIITQKVINLKLFSAVLPNFNTSLFQY